MALFLHSIKCAKYLRNTCKLIQINESDQKFLYLRYSSSLPRIKENRYPKNFYTYPTQNIDTEFLLKKFNKQLENKKLVDNYLIDEIIQSFELLGNIDSLQALTILRSCNVCIQCTPEQRNNLANTLWKLFETYNIQMDVSYYNTLLDIYLDNKYEFSPLDILSTMEKKSIEPNKDTYKKILRYYCMKGNMQEAMTVFQCMKKENHCLTTDVFDSLILGYSQNRDLKNAVNVFKIMKKINVAPTNETYTALMCAFATQNDIQSIKEILTLCENKNVNIKDKDILNLIYTLIANKNVDYIDELLNKIKKPNIMEVLNFLAKIIDLKQEKIAIKMFYYIYSGPMHRLTRNNYERFFINKFMNHNMPNEKIIKICKTFYSRNNKDIFRQTIYYAFKQNNHDLASELLKEWKINHKLRPHYFWPFLIKFQNNHDAKGLLDYVREMKEVYQVVPCISTVANYILPNIVGTNMNIIFQLNQFDIPVETTRNAIVYYWLKNCKTKICAQYVTEHPCHYDDFVLTPILKWSLTMTFDIDSYLTIAENLYKETTSGVQEKVTLDNKILEIIDFLEDNPTCASKVLQYLSKNNLSISNDIHEILMSTASPNLTNTKSQLLENLSEINNSSVETHSDDFNKIGIITT
ncbi:hypothetical protein M0802_006541 [Mischocyttarus mexicanus]|nr:hypothetical protein M0802_006541 [Mischocyttarus mexicanus]